MRVGENVIAKGMTIPFRVDFPRSSETDQQMRLFKFRRNAPGGKKTWNSSQKYELEHAIDFMNGSTFRALHGELTSGRLRVSGGYRDPLMLQEFFGGNPPEFDEFLSHIEGRVCLDIGPCTMSQIAGWDVAKERIAIEPLLEPIVLWQETNLGKSAYDGFRNYAKPAEVLVAELVLAIDGAIVCRNMLDHTPSWPFVLANISSYAVPGCKLLLWTDLDHRGTDDEGHYNITSDVSAFRRLVEQLGFNVIREYTAVQRHELNWGCLAERGN